MSIAAKRRESFSSCSGVGMYARIVAMRRASSLSSSGVMGRILKVRSNWKEDGNLLAGCHSIRPLLFSV